MNNLKTLIHVNVRTFHLIIALFILLAATYASHQTFLVFQRPMAAAATVLCVPAVCGAKPNSTNIKCLRDSVAAEELKFRAGRLVSPRRFSPFSDGYKTVLFTPYF